LCTHDAKHQTQKFHKIWHFHAFTNFLFLCFLIYFSRYAQVNLKENYFFIFVALWNVETILIMFVVCDAVSWLRIMGKSLVKLFFLQFFLSIYFLEFLIKIEFLSQIRHKTVIYFSSQFFYLIFSANSSHFFDYLLESSFTIFN
jgi:hypothetical protein